MLEQLAYLLDDFCHTLVVSVAVRRTVRDPSTLSNASETNQQFCFTWQINHGSTLPARSPIPAFYSPLYVPYPENVIGRPSVGVICAAEVAALAISGPRIRERVSELAITSFVSSAFHSPAVVESAPEPNFRLRLSTREMAAAFCASPIESFWILWLTCSMSVTFCWSNICASAVFRVHVRSVLASSDAFHKCASFKSAARQSNVARCPSPPLGASAQQIFGRSLLQWALADDRIRG